MMNNKAKMDPTAFLFSPESESIAQLQASMDDGASVLLPNSDSLSLLLDSDSELARTAVYGIWTPLERQP